jgi:hypothetical protein
MRCLIATGGPVHFNDLINWSYAGRRRSWRWPIYRALKRQTRLVELGALMGAPAAGIVTVTYSATCY